MKEWKIFGKGFHKKESSDLTRSKAFSNNEGYSRVIDPKETLVPDGFVPDYGNPIFRDQRGRKLYLVIEDPAQQLFSSMLLADVIKRCQVVFDPKTTHFYSYGVHETPKQSKGELIDEALADTFILAQLFGISDRDPTFSHKNISSSEGSVFHYDITANFRRLYWPSTSAVEFEDREKFDSLTPNQRAIVKQKLLRLKTLYEGPGGLKFLTAAFSRAKQSAEMARSKQDNLYHVAAPNTPEQAYKYLSFVGRVNFHLSTGDILQDFSDLQKKLLDRIGFYLSL